VQTPEPWIGHVIGELSRIGSWLENHSNDSPMHTVQARVPVEAVPAFEKWLAQITQGQGRITGGDPVAEEDA